MHRTTTTQQHKYISEKALNKKKKIVYFIHMTLTHSDLYDMTHTLNMYMTDKHINEPSFDRKMYFKA